MDEKVKFDHNSETLSGAIGMTAEHVDELHERYNKLVRELEGSEDRARSRYIEMMYDNFTKLEAIVVLEGLQEENRGIASLMRALRGSKDD